MADIQKRLEKAEKYLQKGKQEDALEEYLEILEEDPNNEKVRQTAADISVAIDRNAEACTLLSALFDPNALSWLREIPSVHILRRVWVQNYQWSDGKLSWRSPENIPPAAQYISSPYDLDAHYS